MPAARGAAKHRSTGWLGPGRRRRYRKKRYHRAFRVLIALGLVPSKSRQTDPHGLRLVNTMHVMEGGEMVEQREGTEAAPELAKLMEEVSAIKPAAELVTVAANGNGQSPRHLTNNNDKVNLQIEEKDSKVEEEAAEEEEADQKEDKEEVEEEEEDGKSVEEEEQPEDLALGAPAATELAKNSTTPSPSPDNVKIEPDTEAAEELVVPKEVGLARKRSIEKSEEAEGEGSQNSSDLSDESERKRSKVTLRGVGESSQESDKVRRTSATPQPSPSPHPPSLETRDHLESRRGMICSDDDREKLMSELMMEATMSAEALSEATERLTKEVESLAEMAAAKEMEWNAILRVRKLKEEMLERLLRRKRMSCLDEQPDRLLEAFQGKVRDYSKTNGGPTSSLFSGARAGGVGRSSGGGPAGRPILPKPPPGGIYATSRGESTAASLAGVLMESAGRGEGRNGPILDVKSIIADYRLQRQIGKKTNSRLVRSRHPESSPPRRGRRKVETRFSGANPALISMANMALGTGSSVRTMAGQQDHVGGGSHPGAFPGAPTNPQEKSGRYPEVTLHPVVSSPPSLLHQVLTKPGGGPPRPPAASFSPTLARLLTAPELRSQPPHHHSASTLTFRTAPPGGSQAFPHPPPPPPAYTPPSPRVSIQDILASSGKQKSRNEITITPVSGNPAVKSKEETMLDDSESEGGDRLVIDEGGEDSVPTCQGCRQKSAQFVCAGCGAQWYCSRECQVTAWEEHSDVCSG